VGLSNTAQDGKLLTHFRIFGDLGCLNILFCGELMLVCGAFGVIASRFMGSVSGVCMRLKS